MSDERKIFRDTGDMTETVDYGMTENTQIYLQIQCKPVDRSPAGYVSILYKKIEQLFED